MPLFDRQGLPCPAFGRRLASHASAGSRTHAVTPIVARTCPTRPSVDAHRQRYVPQFAPEDTSAKQTPYCHRLTGGLVQQGLSVAGDIRDSNQFGSATDKR